MVLPPSHVCIPFLIAVKAETMALFSKTGNNGTRITVNTNVYPIHAPRAITAAENTIYAVNGADGVSCEESTRLSQWGLRGLAEMLCLVILWS